MKEAARRHWAFVLLAAVAMGLPLLAWCGAYYRPDAFGLAAAWVVGGLLILTVPWVGGAVTPPVMMEGAVLIGAALVSIGLCHATDRPPALLALPPRPGRRGHAGPTSLGMGGSGRSGRRGPLRAGLDGCVLRRGAGSDVYLIALPVAGVYLVSLLVAWPPLARVPPPGRRDRPPRHRALHLDRPLPRPLRDQPEDAGPRLRRAGRPLSRDRPRRAPDARRDVRQARVLLGSGRLVPDRGHPRPARPARHHAGVGGRRRSSSCGSACASSPRSPVSAATRAGAGHPAAVRSPSAAPAGRSIPSSTRNSATWIFVIASLGVALLLTREVADDEGGPRSRRCGRCWPRWPSCSSSACSPRETSGTFDQQARRATARAISWRGAERAARRRPGRVRALDGVRDRPPRPAASACATTRCSTPPTACSP